MRLNTAQNEVLAAPTPMNEAPQTAATNTYAATSNLPPIEGTKKLTKHHIHGHFILFEGERAECKYCSQTYVARSKTYGITNLKLIWKFGVKNILIELRKIRLK